MSFIITDNTLSLYYNGKPYTVSKSAVSPQDWERIKNALKDGDLGEVVRRIDTATAVKTHFEGEIEVRNGQLVYKGQVIDTYPAQRAIDFMREGLPYRPLLNFIQRLEANPSYRARQDLYKFLEHGGNPLTDDGHFLAYKKVKRVDGKLVDIYTRTFSNEPGVTVQIPRNQVDEDPQRTCSHGLHVCSYTYLPHFGTGCADEVVVVKVDPADVVAIPTDYHNTKMRVCRYQVLETLADYSRDVLRDSAISDWDQVDESEDFDDEDDESEDWATWDGGLLAPDLAPDERVEVVFRNGGTVKGRAGSFRWDHRQDGGDIVAYRLI